MSRRRLHRIGIRVALTSLLVLNLHVLAHIFGFDHDQPGVPCALCQAVLVQVTLQAAPTVEAPKDVTVLYVTLSPSPIPFVGTLARGVDARGPPPQDLLPA